MMVIFYPRYVSSVATWIATMNACSERKLIEAGSVEYSYGVSELQKGTKETRRIDRHL